MSAITTSLPLPAGVSDVREQGARVRPDRLWVGVAAIILVLIVMLASMVFSFTALSEAASWTHNPTWSYPLVPIFVDGAILTFSLSLVVFRWRGQGTKRTMAILIGFTLLSCAINVMHAGSGWNWDLSNVEAWTGMLISGMAPIAALLACEEVTRLTFVSHRDPVAVDGTAEALFFEHKELKGQSEPEPKPTPEPAPEPEPEAEPVVRPEGDELSHPVLELPPARQVRPRPRQPLLTFATEN